MAAARPVDSMDGEHVQYRNETLDLTSFIILIYSGLTKVTDSHMNL